MCCFGSTNGCHLFAVMQKASMDFAEITVDHKFHPHIIGKNGSNGEKAVEKNFRCSLEFVKMITKLVFNSWNSVWGKLVSLTHS